MTEKFQHILQRVQQSKALRIVNHIVFWLIVGFFYFLIFNWNNDFRQVSLIYSIGLLPLAVLVTYLFNYLLVPKYLWAKRYGRFFFISFMTLLFATWLSFLIVFFALIFILNTEASLERSVLHPELQVITLNFIVFLAISIKQIKRTFLMQEEKNKLEKDRLNTELKLKEAELKLLKAQIHPHFLFNTLNNLYGLTLEKSDEAPELVLKLSEILDYILYRCNEKSVALTDEIENLKNYISIEKIRYSEKLKLYVKFPVDCGEMQIAPLVLLPFVENAFKHGVSNFPGTAFVAIHTVCINSTLVFKVENSKHSAEKNNTNPTPGIGLKNVKKRLDLMYPEKYILRIDEKKETFSVHLTIELAE